MTATKRCSKCKEILPISRYHKGAVTEHNVRPECKDGKSKTDAEYSALNSAKRVATAKAWRLKYPERRKAHVRNSYARKRVRENALQH